TRVSGYAVFSADGKRLAVEGAGGLHLWDARTGEEVHALDLRPAGIGTMSVSPDGKRLALGMWYGQKVKVVDWDGDRLTEARTLEGHQAAVKTVAYSPDGRWLASGDANGFKLWNAETLALVRAVETPAQELAFTPDSRILFATSMTDQ